MPVIDAIDDFLALVRTASFTRAAEARHITQPAFTRRIQNLEAEVGPPLFDRTKTPITLTRAGQRFLSYAQNLSYVYSQAMTDVGAIASQISDPVRFAAPHTLATTFFPAFWKNCVRAHPSLKVSLTGQRIETCIADLLEGHVDLALIQTTKTELKRRDLARLSALTLASDKMVPVLAPFAETNSHKWLAHSPEVALGNYVRDALPKTARAKMEVVFESPSSEVLKAMTLAGHGFAYLPESLIEDERHDGYLVQHPAKWPSIPLDIVLLRAQKAASHDCEMIWHVAEGEAHKRRKGK